MRVKMMAVAQANAQARNTKAVKCFSCNEVIPETIVDEWTFEEVDNDCFQIEGLTGYTEEGKCAYGCPKCILPLRYHDRTRRENITGTQNTTELRLGDISQEYELWAGIAEPSKEEFIELLENDADFARVYISSLTLGKSASGQGQQSTEDCTVTVETPLRNQDLCSSSAWLHGMTEKELSYLNNEHCGAHIHVNANHCGYNDTVKTIYEQVLARIEAMTPTERIEWFGSDFRDYAGDEVGRWHDCTINIAPSTNHTIEFRLTRVRTADQYIQACKWWRATVQVVNHDWHKVVDGKWTALHLGRKAAKQFDRLLSGAFAKGK